MEKGGGCTHTQYSQHRWSYAEVYVCLELVEEDEHDGDGGEKELWEHAYISMAMT